MGLRRILLDNKSEVTDVLFLVMLQGVNFIAPLVVFPYLMKVLDAAHFGYIGFSLSVCQYLQLLVDFGFNLSATKRISMAKGHPDEINKIFSAVFYAKLLLLAISAVLLVLLTCFPAFAPYRSTLYVLFLMVVANAFLFVFLLQGIGQVRWISILTAVAKFSVLPLTFVLVHRPEDYLLAAALQALVAVVATLLSLGLIAYRKWVKLLAFDWPSVKNEMRESWNLFLSSAATNVYTACFVIILGLFCSPEEVGRYSAADRVMRALCYAALLPVLQAFYPKVCRVATTDRSGAWRLGRQLLCFEVLVMFLVGGVLFVGGGYLESWLGGNYAGTASLFRMNAFVPLFVGMGGVLGQLMVLALGGNRERVWFKRVYYVAAMVALLGVFTLAPYFGAMGTTTSLLLTEITVFVGFVVLVIQMRKEESHG